LEKNGQTSGDGQEDGLLLRKKLKKGEKDIKRGRVPKTRAEEVENE
jgi:hypothetical protein